MGLNIVFLNIKGPDWLLTFAAQSPSLGLAPTATGAQQRRQRTMYSSWVQSGKVAAGKGPGINYFLVFVFIFIKDLIISSG